MRNSTQMDEPNALGRFSRVSQSLRDCAGSVKHSPQSRSDCETFLSVSRSLRDCVGSVKHSPQSRSDCETLENGPAIYFNPPQSPFSAAK